MKQRSLAVFGLVDILVEYTLTMIGFQGLITELEVWKLHHQTLRVNCGQNTFQGNSNKLKYEDHERLMKEIQVNFEEANDLLEQMELESRGAATISRVSAYKAELQRVKDEYRSVISRSGNCNLDMDEVYDDWDGAAEQHRKLLDNTERLERSGQALSEGYRVVLETEQIGTVVLNELNEQRDTIQKAKGRVILYTSK
ncbi:Vesicle transport through interaction with t-SNAREs homolog 1A [Eumeta japonica]|uniref:Vesicle transport through interaction with t-SNAREs homolog 1A n=1 Tax=Eumeta variegata TaxID=151549 RepID=A0A4C1X4E9_EUMVA|nr:Vesicle transport through interaction with t-SNAREs homolog 1A [Eumeta japonica]